MQVPKHNLPAVHPALAVARGDLRSALRSCTQGRRGDSCEGFRALQNSTALPDHGQRQVLPSPIDGLLHDCAGDLHAVRIGH